MKKIIIILLATFSLYSCTTIDIISNPDLYVKKNYSDAQIIVYDTIKVKVEQYEHVLTEAVAGEQPKKRLVIDKIGKKVEFQKGEPIELISNGFNFANASIKITTDEENNRIELEVIDSQLQIVKFEKKCQCIEVRNINQLPPIDLNPGLDPHQIVITPIFNNNNDCQLVGYQIRYGDQKYGGCTQAEATQVHNTFKNCIKKIDKNANQTNFSGNKIKKQEKSLSYILFKYDPK